MKKRLRVGLVVLLGVFGFVFTGFAQDGTPIVLFPGYGGTRLVTTVENQTVAPTCPASGTFESWIFCDQPSSFSPACRDRLMTLIYDRQPTAPMSQRFSQPPGVRVTVGDYGATPSAPGYEPFFAALEANGYTRNLNIRVAGYDWRLTPDIGHFLQRTIHLIEQTYADNGNTPVHLVAHSNGPFYALYLLQHTSQAWKDTYIHGFTPIAGNWPGQGGTYFMFFTGFHMNELVFPADTESARVSALMFQSHPAWYMTTADPAVFKNQEVVLQAGSVAYTPQHYRKLFRDAGLSLAEELGPYYIGFVPFEQPTYFPNVDVYAEIGSGLDTLVGLGLPDLTVGQVVDDSTQWFFRPGDSNEEDITNTSIVAWRKMDCFRFELHDNPGVSHMDLVVNADVLGRLLVNVGRPKSACTAR